MYVKILVKMIPTNFWSSSLFFLGNKNENESNEREKNKECGRENEKVICLCILVNVCLDYMMNWSASTTERFMETWISFLTYLFLNWTHITTFFFNNLQEEFLIFSRTRKIKENFRFVFNEEKISMWKRIATCF